MKFFKEIFQIVYFREEHFYALSLKHVYSLLVIQENFTTYSSDVAFSTNCLCTFFILSIIILKFSISNVQKNISKYFTKSWKDFAYFCTHFLCTCSLAIQYICIPIFFAPIIKTYFSTDFIRVMPIIFYIFIKLLAL